MIRVVIDTNVVISAMLNPYGYPSVVLHTIITNKNIQWYGSKVIMQEYQSVIGRTKFKISPDLKRQFINLLYANITIVEPGEVVSILDDDGDNRFLECAKSSKAHFLITGNRKDFTISYFGNTRIITPRDFIEIILGT